jgi:hypothetical protein
MNAKNTTACGLRRIPFLFLTTSQRNSSWRTPPGPLMLPVPTFLPQKQNMLEILS